MRHYEIATVLHPDLEIDIEGTLAKIESIITGTGGTVTKKDNWGKRKLAYRINGQEWGIFVFFTCELEPKAVTSIEAALNITEEVMRHLVVSLEHPQLVNARKQKNAGKKAKTQSKVDDKQTDATPAAEESK